ncbi:MAG: CAP domain-containing protein [Acidimicrobiia bacterium]
MFRFSSGLVSPATSPYMRTAYLYGLFVFAVLAAALTGLSVSGEPEKAVAAYQAPSTQPSPTTSAVLVTSTSTTPDAGSEPEDGITAEQIGQLAGSTTTTSEPVFETAAQPAGTQPPPATSQPPPATSQPPATVATTTTAPPPTTVVQGGPNAEFEAQFASLIDSYRSGNGLGGLIRDGSLDSRARSWSEGMAESGGLSHSNLGSIVPPWTAAAENVGMGGSVGAIFDALAGSSGHRSNMLGDYTHYGVGVWVDSSGAIWTTHVFTR